MIACLKDSLNWDVCEFWWWQSGRCLFTLQFLFFVPPKQQEQQELGKKILHKTSFQFGVDKNNFNKAKKHVQNEESIKLSSNSFHKHFSMTLWMRTCNVCDITVGIKYWLLQVPFPISLFILREKFHQNFISSRDGLEKSTETRQKWKHTRRLPYYGAVTEKKDKKTTLHLLYIQQI